MSPQTRGREGGCAAGADKATRRLWGSPPLRISSRGMPWGLLPRTRLPGGKGSGGPTRRTRPRCGWEVMTPPWMRPRGHPCGVSHGRGHDEKRERGPPLQTQPQDGRCGHHLCRKICVDGCGICRRRRGRGDKGKRDRRPPPQTKSQDCRMGCRFCGQGLVRRREGSGDLSS